MTAQKPCENFLYWFKAAPRGRSRRQLGRLSRACRSAPVRLACTAGWLARKQDQGPQEPGAVSEPRRI